jgi:hypothetical protein
MSLMRAISQYTLSRRYSARKSAAFPQERKPVIITSRYAGFTIFVVPLTLRPPIVNGDRFGQKQQRRLKADRRFRAIALVRKMRVHVLYA